MAKKAAAKKTAKREVPQFKYTAASLAKDLNLEPASVRIKLRNHKVKKNGGVYGWDSQTEYQSVLKKLKGDAKPAKKTETKKAA